jgi:HEAT repeat protein
MLNRALMGDAMIRRNALGLLTVLALVAGSALGKDEEATYRGKTVAAWKEILKTGDLRQRLSAVLALGEAGREALPALPELTAVLKDSQVLVRRAAAQTLAGLGADAAPAAAKLAQALRDPDPLVRQLSAQALSEIGEPAVPALLNALKDSDGAVRAMVVWALDGLSARGPEVVKALAHAAVKDSHGSVRRLALSALANMADEAKDAVPLLVGLLRDKEANLRTTAAIVLVKIGKDSVPELVKLLKDSSADVRLSAIQTLSQFGKEDLDEAAVTALVKALGDDNSRVRQVAAAGMALLGTRARELGGGSDVSKALFALSKDKDARVRRAAVAALGQIGLDEKEEITALATALTDKDVNVRAMTIYSLSQYSHDKAPDDWRQHVMSCMAAGLRDSDRRIQFATAQTMAPEGKFAVPALIGVVENGKGTACLFAAMTLGEIGAEASAAIPALEKMSKTGNTKEARYFAKAALEKIQP